MTRCIDDCANELRVSREALLRHRVAMAAVVRSIGVDAAHVDDVVHDAFVLACGKPEMERPDPKDDEAFGAWLCTLAKYAAKTNRRDAFRSRETPAPAEEIELVAEEKDAYLGPFEDRVIASTVFERLSRDDGALLHEHFYEDKDIKDLAEEQGIPWSTMRSRVDCALDRARITVRDVAPRTGRRRRRAWAIPLALLGFAAREARAHVGSLWVRFFGALRRGPARLIGFGATAAVILAATPDSGSHAADGFATGAQNIQSAGSEDAPRCADLVRSTLASPREAPKTTIPRNITASPPRRYEQRSTSVWMIANAIRDAEAQAKQ